MSACVRFLPPAALVLPSPAACRFLSAGEFVHAALSAYYAASQSLRPPHDEPWIDGGRAYACPEDFKSFLLEEVEERLWTVAVARGYAVPDADEDAGADEVGEAHGDALALLTANPLLLAPERQQLPARESVVHDQPNRSTVA